MHTTPYNSLILQCSTLQIIAITLPRFNFRDNFVWLLIGLLNGISELTHPKPSSFRLAVNKPKPASFIHQQHSYSVVQSCKISRCQDWPYTQFSRAYSKHRHESNKNSKYAIAHPKQE